MRLNIPLVIIHADELKQEGLTPGDAKRYFPNYLTNPVVMQIGISRNILYRLLKFIIELATKILLRTPRRKVGDLDIKEVDEVYTREAQTYNKKHHLTTRGMDLHWRRYMGWFIAMSSLRKGIRPRILDLCTGTGLTVKEICKVLSEWELGAEIIGLDYNTEMLRCAIADWHEIGHCHVKFARGDAMDLVRSDSNNYTDNFIRFNINFFDYVVQMFGVGGIDNPKKQFSDILQILKPGGEFFLIDMHRPIPELSGELPVLFKWFKLSKLELFLYEYTTVPLVLNKLWGWRDTTLCFYTLPLTVYRDEAKCWGFEVIYFEQESQRWWLSLPFMPTGKILVRKVQISYDEAVKREKLMKLCLSKPSFS